MSQQTPNDTIGTIPIAAEPAPQENQPSPPPPPPPPANRRRAGHLGHWLLLVPAVLFLGYLLAGFILMPYLARTLLPSRLAATLNRPVTVGGADFNPFTLTLTLHNGIIGPDLDRPDDPVDPVLSFGRLRLDLAAASLLKRGIFSQQTDIDRLFLHLVREKDGTYNLAGILPWLQTSPGQTPALPFSLDNITLASGRILFDDHPAGKTHEVGNISLSLPSLANVAHQADRYIKPRFSATLNGSPLHLTGETEMTDSGLTARLNLKLEKFDLAANLAYLPPILDGTVVKGEADLDFKLIFATSATADARLQLQGAGVCRDIWLQDDAGRELARLPHLTFKGEFAPLASTYHLGELLLDKPEFLIEKKDNGQWILTRFRLPATASGNIDRLRVSDGKLTFLDRAVPGGFTDTWSAIQLSLESPAAGSGKPATFAAEAVDSAGSHLAAQGEIGFRPLTTSGLLVMDRLELPRLAPYLTDNTDLLLKSGQASKIQLRFRVPAAGTGPETSLLLSDGAMQLNSLVLATNKGVEHLTAPLLTVTGASMNLADHAVNLGRMAGPTGNLRLDFAAAKTPAASTAAAPTPWRFDLQELALAKATVTFPKAATTTDALAVNDLRVGFTATSKTAATKHLTASGRLDADSPFSLDGEFTPHPFSALLNTSVARLPLPTLAGLVTQPPQLQAAGGTLQAKGRLSLPDGRFTGEATVMEFSGRDQNGAEAVRCQRAVATGLDFIARPFSVLAARLEMSHPFIVWRLRPDRQTDLPRLLLPKAPAKTGRPAWDIKELRVRDGQVALSDQSVTPPYNVLLTKLHGEINDLSERAGGTSRFTLQGTVDNDAVLTLSGTAKLLGQAGDSEIHAAVADFAISPLAPYLAPHLGYTLAGGKLAMQTTYRCRGNAVSADNHLQITALDLGRPLNGSRQLALAVALLTDNDGRIGLDLPVAGTQNEPGYSFRGALVRALRNLLLKTAVTPAALLADLNHGTPPPSLVIFTPGRDQLSAPGQALLQTFATILAQRPRLALTITGRADAATDRAALLAEERRKEAERQAAEARRQAAKISAELAQTYGHEEIRPADAAPAVKAATEPKAIAIDDARLLALAGQRAAVVRRFLIDAGVAPERLLLSPRPALETGATTARPGSRVDFGFTGPEVHDEEERHGH